VELHRGICRTVLLIGPYAVKVPTTRPYGHRGGLSERLTALARGVLANQSEYAWRGQDGLCPIVLSLASIVQVYVRCRPVTDEEVPDPELDPAWWRAIAPTVPFGDKKAANLGWLGDHLVWVDFDSTWNGCPHTPWNAFLDDD
jgi:hypothetical protein